MNNFAQFLSGQCDVEVAEPTCPRVIWGDRYGLYTDAQMIQGEAVCEQAFAARFTVGYFDEAIVFRLASDAVEACMQGGSIGEDIASEIYLALGLRVSLVEGVDATHVLSSDLSWADVKGGDEETNNFRLTASL